MDNWALKMLGSLMFDDILLFMTEVEILINSAVELTNAERRFSVRAKLLVFDFRAGLESLDGRLGIMGLICMSWLFRFLVSSRQIPA